MESFKNFLTIFIIILIFLLWFIPPFMIYQGGGKGWGGLYIPVVGLTFLWGDTIAKKYFSK